MPKLKLEIGDQLNEAELREDFATLASDEEFMQVLKAMLKLLKSGDLGFWLSPQLMRKLKAFAVERWGEIHKGPEQVDEMLFISWLQQGGSMQPPIDWQVEMLPNNGGIYRMLLEGGQDGKGIHDNQG